MQLCVIVQSYKKFGIRWDIVPGKFKGRGRSMPHRRTIIKDEDVGLTCEGVLCIHSILKCDGEDQFCPLALSKTKMPPLLRLTGTENSRVVIGVLPVLFPMMIFGSLGETLSARAIKALNDIRTHANTQRPTLMRAPPQAYFLRK